MITAPWSRASHRYRTGIPWRDLPREAFGPWQTAWKRHKTFAGDGTWDRVLAQLMAEADAAGEIDWTVSADSTINRVHQHATNTTRPKQDTGGDIESQAEPHGPSTVNPQVTASAVLAAD
ncbi:Transposase [Occultella aeris]|uniref:Insertion element IS402-like domain-containing protein n=1 Tax=Occultella aeris TaxID=2761496 RepID=A0A7M4DF47_9MICO|nr:hypothetical protein HALOF300_00738 [Occultella aeris]